MAQVRISPPRARPHTLFAGIFAILMLWRAVARASPVDTVTFNGGSFPRWPDAREGIVVN